MPHCPTSCLPGQPDSVALYLADPLRAPGPFPRVLLGHVVLWISCAPFSV